MGYVNALGYVGIETRNFEEWSTFASEVLGLQVIRELDESGVETLYLRMDQRHHRIAVREGEDAFSYAGWEVATEADLEMQIQTLEESSIPFKEDTALASLRGVRRLVRCVDPAGFQVEIYFGGPSAGSAFLSPTGVEFITQDHKGNDLGVGHIVFVTPNMNEMVDFYKRVLGFKISDYITFEDFVLTFMHVNPRHHSLAFGPSPDGRAYMDHIMLEVDSIDGVGQALDTVLSRELSLTASLGRHTNDEMLSFYVESPSGIGVEYGTAGKLIDDETWSVTNWDSTKVWGHDRNHAH